MSGLSDRSRAWVLAGPRGRRGIAVSQGSSHGGSGLCRWERFCGVSRAGFSVQNVVCCSERLLRSGAGCQRFL